MADVLGKRKLEEMRDDAKKEEDMLAELLRRARERVNLLQQKLDDRNAAPEQEPVPEPVQPPVQAQPARLPGPKESARGSKWEEGAKEKLQALFQGVKRVDERLLILPEVKQGMRHIQMQQDALLLSERPDPTQLAIQFRNLFLPEVQDRVDICLFLDVYWTKSQEDVLNAKWEKRDNISLSHNMLVCNGRMI